MKEEDEAIKVGKFFLYIILAAVILLVFTS